MGIRGAQATETLTFTIKGKWLRMLDLSKLNAAQRESVLHDNSPLLVLAGAGTGKTTAITYRIAHFIFENGVAPDKILAMTFTNKAAKEMRFRVSQLTGVPEYALHVSTFHSFCGKMLRKFGSPLGLDSHYVIYDQDDQLQAIKQCLIELNLDHQVFPPRLIRSIIEKWKNQGLRADYVQPSQFDMNEQRAAEIYKLYEKKLRNSNAVDFGSLLLNVVFLLQSDTELRRFANLAWSHLLVDEYQDTNPVQYQLLKYLAEGGKSLTVVGDDDQSIYRWRGADIQNILRFEEDYTGSKVVRLEENYRSTPIILKAANAVIANNQARKGKTLYTKLPKGSKIDFRVFATEREEADAIALDIHNRLNAGECATSIAILYRTNAQSRPLEDALRRLKINYAIYGGIRFYDRKEIKDALAYLRLLLNPKSDMDFLRIINVPARGIGKTSLQKLQAYASGADSSLLEASKAFAEGAGEVQSRLRTKLRDFLACFEKHQEQSQQENPGDLAENMLRDFGYLDSLKEQDNEEATERLENVSELLAALHEYCDIVEEPSLELFLEEVALATDLDNLNDTDETVSLMTLHASKGLEFKKVFIPGFEEGMFPHNRSLESTEELEEERRLCYVGITRAKESLSLSSCRIRTVFGSTKWSEISRFISELPDDCILLTNTNQSKSKPPAFNAWGVDENTENLPVFNRPVQTNDPFAPGKAVLHATFGQGKVIQSHGDGKNRKLTVTFPGIGTKTIVARFVNPA